MSYTKTIKSESDSGKNDLLNRMAGFLINNANPSIVFHVKNDIRHLDITNNLQGGLTSCRNLTQKSACFSA